MSASPAELLFEAVSSADWPRALELVHALRKDEDSVAEHAREVLVASVATRLEQEPSSIPSACLERILLLHRAGFLPVSDERLDAIATRLVLRHRDEPAVAARYARYRPEADACRGVLVQFEAAGVSVTEDVAGGQVSGVDGGFRTDGRRSLFRSRQEAILFRAAQRVFPGQILVPNGALHAAIEFDSIRGVLDAADRDTFFRVLIDLVVFDANEPFKAALFVELDSPWHDDPRAVTRDRLKERMLSLAGCPVIRIRPPGGTDLAGMITLLEGAVATRSRLSASHGP